MSEKNRSINPKNDVPINKHSAKSFVAAMILGVFIGLAVIIPGVSGSTIAIIFGLYTAMLYAFGNILTDFKRCFAFLLPIGIGVVVGFSTGFLVIQKFFEPYIFQVICLFVGLMIGAIPALTIEIKGERANPLRHTLFFVGIAIPIAIGVISILLTSNTPSTDGAFETIEPWRIAVYFPLGFIVSITQIVPGLSATAILMAFGQFAPILDSLHLDYLLNNPTAILLFASLGFGFVCGIIVVSRIFSAILKKHKSTAFFAVIGLSFGSIASMFINPDVFAVYGEWAQNGISLPTALIAAALLVIGFIPSFLLTRYELKNTKK